MEKERIERILLVLHSKKYFAKQIARSWLQKKHLMEIILEKLLLILVLKTKLPLIRSSLSKAAYLLDVNIPAHFRSSSAVTCGMNAFMKGIEELTFHQHIFNDSEVEKGMIAFLSTQHIKLDYSPYR